MAYVTKEQINKAREMDLLTYLQTYEPQELVHISGQNYCTKTHDSLKISNGKWNWFSRGIGGKTALDYLIKVKNYSFTCAVELLAKDNVSYKTYDDAYESKKPKEFILPEKNKDNLQLISYLSSRGIHKVIINFCIKRGLIYESLPYHNVVFVSMDKDQKARYASLRSTTASFKGDAKGSDKRYGFCIADNTSSKTVHVFESAIDLLSYTTLKLLSGENWRDGNYLSLAGIFKSKTKIPLALDHFLNEHKSIQNINLHLDNDQAGRDATASIIEVLGDKYNVVDEPPKQGKDVNEYLQNMLRIRHERHISNER